MRTAVIINDCRDDNAAARQVARVSSILQAQPTFIGVQNDLEAAGNIVDALDAFGGNEGAILCNVAPRSGEGQRWPNGSPFGFFYYGQTVVVTTIDGLTLSLVKKLGVAQEIQVCDLRRTVGFIGATGFNVPHSFHEDYVQNTQFRSYEFSPYLAQYLLDAEFPKDLPGVTSALSMEAIPDALAAVWWVDNFGNCKTTLLREELLRILKHPPKVAFPWNLPDRHYLKDVLHLEAAFVEGSSGLGINRFLEIVVRGGDASVKFNLQSGSSLLR